ncbi:MAG: universal stress protein [Anaerolineae bacterium]|nr:universal stress protein [Anaerolineae bacterium]MDQ7035369.1 universal stress protein [Anaerolineae bacterium]
MPEQGRYKKIVVPIDGSGWSERAIPHAVDIARNNNSELILLHVFKPPANEYIGEIALANQEEQLQQLREEAKQHLMALRNQIRSEKVTARVQFIEGTGVASIICDYINGEDVDLVVMSSHGRTGIRRWLFGSVAQKVMQDVSVPVMLIRPDKGE